MNLWTWEYEVLEGVPFYKVVIDEQESVMLHFKYDYSINEFLDDLINHINMSMVRIAIERVGIEAQLLGALKSLRHGDGCFCDAAFAGPGTTVTHSPECIAARVAIKAAAGEEQ